MTWAQGVFAFCGGVMAPAVAILCAWRLRRQDESPLKGCVLGFGMVFGALVACSFLAVLLFPGYPEVPVSEPVAISFTIPVLIASILGVRWVAGKGSGANRFRTVGTGVLVALYLSGIALAYQMTVWPYRRALPWSASGVKEYARADGFLPDFIYYLRATVTEEQFHDYVDRFGPVNTGSQEYFAVETYPVAWWKPSAGTHEVFRREDGDWSMEAIYDNGIMWVTASEH